MKLWQEKCQAKLYQPHYKATLFIPLIHLYLRYKIYNFANDFLSIFATLMLEDIYENARRCRSYRKENMNEEMPIYYYLR